MSQYSYNFGNEDEDIDYFDNLNYMVLQNYDFEDKKDIKATHFSDDYQNSPGIISKRSFNLLNISSQAQDRYVRAKKGHGKETMMLNMNFKTLIKHEIKKLSVLKKLNKIELINSFQFIKSTPSFQNLRKLFHPEAECSELKAQIQACYNSIQIINAIMSSGISFEQKIKMVKYIHRMSAVLKENRGNHRWKF